MPGTATAPPTDDTSLDRLETNAHPLARQSAAQSRIHSPVQDERRRLIDAFLTSESERHHKRADKLGQCCRSPWLHATPDDRPIFALSRCRDRLCPTCSKIRAGQVVDKIQKILRGHDTIRFVTLTLKSSDEPLRDQLDRLAESFRTLRRRAFWKEHVTGGLFVTEITHNAKTEQWHPHLHLIVAGGYMPQAQLRAEWHEITGDSMVVDIRIVVSRDQAARYVASYIAKGNEIDRWDDEQIRIFADAIHRRRLWDTFGSFRTKNLDEDEEDEAQPTRPVISFRDLQLMVDAGDDVACTAAAVLKRLSRYADLALHVPADYELDHHGPIDEEEAANATALADDVARRLAFDHAEVHEPGQERPRTLRRDSTGRLFEDLATIAQLQR